MNARRKIHNFYQRWNIRVSDDGEFIKFRNRVASLLDQVLGHIILSLDPNITRDFAYRVGIERLPETSDELSYFRRSQLGAHFSENDVYKTIANATNRKDLVTALQYLFWVLEEHKTERASEFANELRKAIMISPTIDIRIVQRGNHVTLYPGGAKLLDENVVNETLEWLDDYPQVSEPFEEALRIYQAKDVKKNRNLLDNLRVAVEQLLQVLLKNRRTLENQKAPLAEWLEAHGVHKQVQNMYASMLFGPYAMYQNEAVKHGDKSSPVEVEYMIYLTGTFIRFLLQVSQETAHGS